MRIQTCDVWFHEKLPQIGFVAQHNLLANTFGLKQHRTYVSSCGIKLSVKSVLFNELLYCIFLYE